MEATNYFQHDYRSRLDKKLLKIRMKHHMAGVGVYWCLVEMLHEGNGFIEMDTETIAYELQCDEQIVKDIIDICFEYVKDTITCNRVIENLEFRQQKWEAKSQKGKEAADKRWEEYRKQKGNLYQTDTQPIDNLSKTYTTPIPNHAIEKEKEKEKEKVIDKDKLLAVYTAEPLLEIENTDVDYMVDESEYEITQPMLERVIDKFIAVDSKFKYQSVIREIDEDYGGFDNLIELYLPNDTSAQNNFKNKLNQYRNGIFA